MPLSNNVQPLDGVGLMIRERYTRYRLSVKEYLWDKLEIAADATLNAVCFLIALLVMLQVVIIGTTLLVNFNKWLGLM